MRFSAWSLPVNCSLPASPSFVERVCARDPRALARAISIVEEGPVGAADVVQRLYPKSGRAWLVGITGPPGAGKSTLVDRLINEIRRVGQTVGVIAVDPSSPFTGGALLGDRVRMGAQSADAGVFIRSMATRGHLGGVSRATADAALVLDAAGFDVVIIETVGVGQGEVDIVRATDVVLLTLMPGGGDDVQASKAGIMEIADIFVVNKADRDGCDHLMQSLTSALALNTTAPRTWQPPVLKTVATDGAGVRELWGVVESFRARDPIAVADRRRARHEHRLRDLLSQRLLQHVATQVSEDEWRGVIDAVASRQTDPYSAVTEIMTRMVRDSGDVSMGRR